MKRLILVPNGWPCMLEDCPPGFYVSGNTLCFKTNYRRDGNLEVYCKDGRAFWGGTDDRKLRDQYLVQPVIQEWDEYEECNC